jgi:uncharacterized SAM-binding protein YcdF (DUF218 family)
MDLVEKKDAIVVLSGMLGGFESENGFITEWFDPDRFFVGIELVKADKADKIIFTRGKMPWSNIPPEGELLRLKAIEMGIPDSQILLTDIVTNTADEAREVDLILNQEGLNSIVLVTSSFHMPRAKLLFDKAGITNETYPTDFKADYNEATWLWMIPSADAFRKTSLGIREYIGRIYYWLRFS